MAAPNKKKDRKKHLDPNMVAGFRRSVSFPASKSFNSSGGAKHKGRFVQENSHHLRSVSLPYPSHPAVSQLENEIRALKAWQSRPAPEHGCQAWLCDGLSGIERIHVCVDELLQLPHAKDCLRKSGYADRLLEDFLRLADAYGTFRSAMMELGQLSSEAQVGIRRKDDARLASCARSQKKAEKELRKLASSLRHVARLPAALPSVSDAEEAEFTGIMREAIMATVSASVSVLLGIAAASSTVSTSATSSSSSSRSSWMVSSLKGKLSSKKPIKMVEGEGEAWRHHALEKLEGLEDCIGAMERKSEGLFRNLVKARVVLLNILTP